ncbi:MAG: transposase [Desulfobacterota bacterium]|nr:transposase [Thermodesulfobacteriota bacterium]
MPRQARLDVPGTLHHIMVRGIEKQNIFEDEEDRRIFVEKLQSLVLDTGTRILAWALMKNHVHLLLISGPAGLPTFMRRLLTGYAIGFNRRHQRFGHLFQNRYKSILCEMDSYLLELVRYIHLNPLRAKAVIGLEELEKYPWCGHGVLTGRQKNDWQDRDFVLSFFGFKAKAALRAYREFVSAGKDLGPRPELVGGGLVRSLGGWSQVLSLRQRGEPESYDERILGSGDFIQAVLEEADRKLARQVRARKKAGSLARIIKERCREAGVNERELRSGSRRRAVSELRKKLCVYLYRELGIPLAEIARQVGVGTTGVAMAVKELDAKIKLN